MTRPDPALIALGVVRPDYLALARAAEVTDDSGCVDEVADAAFWDAVEASLSPAAWVQLALDCHKATQAECVGLALVALQDAGLVPVNCAEVVR